MNARLLRVATAAVAPAPFVGLFLAMVNAPQGTAAWWAQAAAVSPYAVAFTMLGIFEACGISDYDRPQRRQPGPEPALVGEILPAHPVRVGAR